MKKKLIALLMAAAMVLTLVPVITAFAEDENAITDVTFNINLPPIDGTEIEIQEATYGEGDEAVTVKEPNATPDVSFSFDGDLWCVGMAYAYVVAGEDTYGAPCAADGYTYFVGTIAAGREYRIALNLHLDDEQNENNYVFAADMNYEITGYEVKDVEVSANNNEKSFTVYATITADTANYMNLYDNTPDNDSVAVVVTVPSSEKTSEPEYVPERAGYNFTGWYEDKDCKTAYEFGETLTGDIDLYAGWEEAPLISEVSLTFTPPKAGDEVKFVPTEIDFYGEIYTVDYPDRLPEIKAGSGDYDLASSYFLTGIPANLEDGASEDEYFEGTFESGKTYGLEITIYSENAVFAAADDLEISIPGTDKIVVDPNHSFGASNVKFYATFTMAPAEYEVDKGAGQTVSPGEGATFHILAPFSLFKNGGKVFVDNNQVAGKFIEAYEGSTVITLKPEYISTLEPGTHELKVEFTDGGIATATFTVEETLADTDAP